MREDDAGVGHPIAAVSTDRTAAFRRVAEGRLHDAYKLASAILGDPTEARDAVHDAWIVAWQRWPSLRDQGRFDAWFRQIIVNTCRNRLRKARRLSTGEVGKHSAPSVPDTSRQVNDRVVVEQGLAHLKPDDRIVLALRYYHDLRIDDIAEVLGVPSGTVKSRLNHAHRRLRAVLEASLSEEGPR